MKMNATQLIIGAQKTVITGDNGEVNDYSKIYYLNTGDDTKEQVGDIPSQLPISQEMFDSIKGLKFPVELILTIETVTAGKGKSEMKVREIKKPSTKTNPTS